MLNMPQTKRHLFITVAFLFFLWPLCAQASSPFNPDDMDYWNADRYMMLALEVLVPDVRVEVEDDTRVMLAIPFAFHMGSLPVIKSPLRSQYDSTLKHSPLLLNFGAIAEMQFPLGANAQAARLVLGPRLDWLIRPSPGSVSPLLSMEGGMVASTGRGLGWFVGGGFGWTLESLAPAFLFPHSVRFGVRWFQTSRGDRWEIIPFDFVMALPGAEWF